MWVLEEAWLTYLGDLLRRQVTYLGAGEVVRCRYESRAQVYLCPIYTGVSTATKVCAG